MCAVLLGVVRGRLLEYMESISAGRDWDEDRGSAEVMFEGWEVTAGCVCVFEEPPPNTRLKKPGLSLGAGAASWVPNNDFRVPTVGAGAVASWYTGTVGRSRSVLAALTNSCA
jgi:hypothetical protein